MITQAQLKARLSYDEKTGIFTRKVGDSMFCPDKNGRINIGLLGKQYAAHKLAFLYVSGSVPSERIEHINGNKSDNRISNLKLIIKGIGISGQKELKEWLDYDRDTGIFTWKKSKQYSAKAGNVAGTIQPSGYLGIGFNGKGYRLHRLAWLYEHGEMPSEIDHINHDRADNRISNLRNISRNENSKNLSMQDRNTSGETGVWWRSDRKTWVAEIRVNYKKIHLGAFKNKQDAIDARKAANIKYCFHDNHGLNLVE